jgi:hypothetical protein
MFHKRVYANERLWLEGSFGTMSCCLAVIRGYDACYMYGNTGYYHHAESICKVRIGLWLLRVCESQRSRVAVTGSIYGFARRFLSTSKVVIIMTRGKKVSKRVRRAAETVSTAPEPTAAQEASVDPAVQQLQEQVSQLTRALNLMREATEEQQVPTVRTPVVGGLPAPTVHNLLQSARDPILSEVCYVNC